ncbi:MAG: GtrA family protein [Clostridia bacterium]|nr:GtrA family protein [Clostridia bacterium]
MKALWKKCQAIYSAYREQINYLIVGGLTTVVSLAVYWLCTATFLNPENSLQLQAANVISWICAVTFAYFTNRRYVFFSQEQNRLKEAGKFVLSRVTTLLMEMGIMWLGVTALGINDRIVKLVAQVIIIIANYVFSKLLVFRKKK